MHEFYIEVEQKCCNLPNQKRLSDGLVVQGPRRFCNMKKLWNNKPREPVPLKICSENTRAGPDQALYRFSLYLFPKKAISIILLSDHILLLGKLGTRVAFIIFSWKVNNNLTFAKSKFRKFVIFCINESTFSHKYENESSRSISTMQGNRFSLYFFSFIDL